MASLNQYIDQLLESSFYHYENSFTGYPSKWQEPSVKDDIIEKEDSFEVRIELPGIPKEDIGLTVEKGKLLVKAEKKSSVGETDRVLAARRKYGTIEKTYSLGEEVDGDNVTALHSDGVLTVVLPKKEIAKPKKVDIK